MAAFILDFLTVILEKRISNSDSDNVVYFPDRFLALITLNEMRKCHFELPC